MSKPYTIPRSDDVLLAECEVDTFGSSGKGGQNVNKRDTAVRLRHLPTGITVVCQRERNQLRNKQIALENLRKKLQDKFRKKKKRVPTKMPDEVKERILSEKKKQSEKKQQRRKPDLEE